MNTKTRYSWMLLTLVMLLASCAQNEFGSIRSVINGQEQEVRIQDVDCFNDFNYGNYGMACVVLIRSNSGIGDYIQFNIADVVNIYDNFLGQELDPLLSPMDSVEASVNGNTVAVLSGSSVNFSKISNLPGSQVCASFYLNLGFGTNGFMEGNFCARVQ